MQELCERRLEKLDFVALLIDGIQIGGQVLVVALGIDESGVKPVMGYGKGPARTPRSSKGC